MVISNDMDAVEQSGIIRVDETDHFGDSWIPPFEHREAVTVRKSEKFSDFYDLYECIGEGKFGKVYRCVEKATQLTLAAKTIRIKRDADRAQIENEVAIMTQMKHKCIAQIYDAFQTSTNDVILIMEIVNGGELFDRVADDSYILTELAVAMILHQLCEAIGYIHCQNIIHLDLKPENIMCVSLEGNQIKLIDFGLAQHYDGQSDLLFMAGTPEFAAPEVIKFEPLDFHTDMWSVGVITYILLSGQSPFLGANVALTYNNVERGEWSFCEEFDENGISEEARDFISKLLVRDKSKRMLPSDCLKHPWIVECRKRAARASQEKPLDTGKLRSYVRNKHFRRLVFGVLFINTVLKMMNTMQEKKSANGMAYVKTMYSLAGRKNRDGGSGDVAETSTSQSATSTKADVNLKTEQKDGSTSIKISNDGTPKVLESIRMEKRKPQSNGAHSSGPKLKPKSSEAGSGTKTSKAVPKASPNDSSKSQKKDDVTKKDEAKPEAKVAKKKASFAPAKSVDKVGKTAGVAEPGSKTLPAKLPFSDMFQEKAYPSKLPAVSAKPLLPKTEQNVPKKEVNPVKPTVEKVVKPVDNNSTDFKHPPVSTLKKSASPAPKSAPETLNSLKPKTVKKASGSVESIVSQLMAKTTDMPAPVKKPTRSAPFQKSDEKRLQPKIKELGSVESILAKVVGKVSEEPSALSAPSKDECKKADNRTERLSTARIPTLSVEALQKQQQIGVLDPPQQSRKTDVLERVSDIESPNSLAEPVEKPRSQKNTLTLTPEKKTTSESRTRVMSKTVKRQTSVKTAAAEESVSTEESTCKMEHTTKLQTKEADVCKTVLGNGSVHVNQKNVQKHKQEVGKPSTVSAEKEVSHRQKLGVLKSEVSMNGKSEISGVEVNSHKTGKVKIACEVSKDKPPIGRCTIDVKNKVVVEKIKSDHQEVTTAEVTSKKELVKKKPSVGRKGKEDSGFKSDGEPCEVKKAKKKIHKSTDNLLDSDCSMKPLTRKSVTFSKEILDSDDQDQKEKKPSLKKSPGFGLMKMKSESTLHKKRFSVDVAKSADDICSSANGKPLMPQPDDAYSFANLRKQLENRIESEKSGHMWKSSTELRFSTTNSSNAKRAMNKWLSMEKNLGD